MVNDIVTRDVKMVPPTATVAEAAKVMKESGVGAVPVLDAPKVVGILTDRDIVVRVVAEDKDPHALQAKEVMSTGVFWCNANDTVDEAATTMEKHQVRRLLVRDSVSDQVVGVISLGDVALGATDRVAAEAIKEVSQDTPEQAPRALPT